MRQPKVVLLEASSNTTLGEESQSSCSKIEGKANRTAKGYKFHLKFTGPVALAGSYNFWKWTESRRLHKM